MKKVIFVLLALSISTNVLAGRIRTLRCNDKKEQGITSLLDYVKSNWRSVKELWQIEGAIRHPGCLKRRFTGSGVVICHKKNFVEPEYYRCLGLNGWSNFGGIRAHFCSNFFEFTDKMALHNRRACYAGLLFKLYGNNCYRRSRFPDSYMSLEEFGFNWYAQNNPVTIEFRDCKN